MKFIKIFSVLFALLLVTSSLSFNSVAVSSDFIELIEDSNLTIDREKGYITGFTSGMTYADIIKDFATDVNIYDYQNNPVDMQDRVASASFATTKDGSDVLFFLVYGEVNGDGLIDGNDAAFIEMLLSEQIYEYEVDPIFYDAAVYADRLDGLTSWDVEACFNEGLMAERIPQFAQPELLEDKAELMQIFNNTINSVKLTRPGVKTVRNFTIPSVTGEGYISQQIAKEIKGNESSSEETFKKGKSHDDAIPIARKTWSSSLTLSDVKDISATDNGDGSFTITVEMPDESYDALTTKASQTTHGKLIDACEFVPESGQEDWYTSVVAKYSGVTIKCRYNSFTGDFISVDYYIPYQVHMLGQLKIILSTYPIDVTVDYLQTIKVTKT